jgi:hypothetical protein
VRKLLGEAFAGIGLAAIVIGATMIYPPAGLIIGGAAIVAVIEARDRGGRGPEA